MSINQEAIIKFIKVRGGVVNLRELSHFNSKDIESLQYQRCVQIGRGDTGIEVELLSDFQQNHDEELIKKEIKQRHEYIAAKLIEKKIISQCPDFDNPPQKNKIYKEKTKQRHEDVAAKVIEKKIISQSRKVNNASLKSRIYNVVRKADYPLTSCEVKRELVDANSDSISAYLSVLIKTGLLVCSNDRKMFRHYTTPDRKHLLIGLERKPKQTEPKILSCPWPRVQSPNQLNLKHRVLTIVVNSQSPMTLQQVKEHLPEADPKTISAYLSLFARSNMLCCSRITKNNIKYYTTPDQTHLLHQWSPKFQSQKVTTRILNVLEHTAIPLNIHGIVAQAEVSRKSAWTVIHKLEKGGAIELKRTGYSLYIALKTNVSAMNNLNQVAGYTLRDQIILAIKNKKHRTDDIMNELINQYSRPHIHRVLREMKKSGTLRSQIKGRYTLYYLV